MRLALTAVGSESAEGKLWPIWVEIEVSETGTNGCW